MGGCIFVLFGWFFERLKGFSLNRKGLRFWKFLF